MEALFNWNRSLARNPEPQTIVGGRSKLSHQNRRPQDDALPGTNAEASRILFVETGRNRRKPSDLAPRHKLQYLLQFLRGEPHQLANNFQLTDANYYTVVDLLEQQYGDKYRLRQLLAQDFIAMRPPAAEVADLRRFHNAAFQITTELRTLGANLDATVLYTKILMAKLPVEMKEEIVRNSKYLREKTVTSILDGLREYACIVERGVQKRYRVPPI